MRGNSGDRGIPGTGGIPGTVYLIPPRGDQFSVAIGAQARPARKVTCRSQRHGNSVRLLMPEAQMIGHAAIADLIWPALGQIIVYSLRDDHFLLLSPGQFRGHNT